MDMKIPKIDPSKFSKELNDALKNMDIPLERLLQNPDLLQQTLDSIKGKKKEAFKINKIVPAIMLLLSWGHAQTSDIKPINEINTTEELKISLQKAKAKFMQWQEKNPERVQKLREERQEMEKKMPFPFKEAADNKAKLMEFFKDTPPKSDADVHALADKLKIEHSVLEQNIYDILASFLNAGKYKDYKGPEFDPEQIKMGIKVEKEHTTDPVIAERIARDHLSEISTYYTRLNAMEREAEKEKEKKVATALDKIASEIEKESPIIALAIDRISDRLEKTAAITKEDFMKTLKELVNEGKNLLRNPSLKKEFEDIIQTGLGMPKEG